MKYIPLSTEDHRGFGYHSDKPYAFSQAIDFFPLTPQEIPRMLGSLPLVFRKTEKGYDFGLPAGILSRLNTLIHPENGKFMLNYVPAVLRRYPFNLTEISDSKVAMMVLDSEEGFAAGRGEALVGLDGVLTEKGQSVQKFLYGILHYLKMNIALSEQIADAGLLTPIEFTVKNPEEKPGAQHLRKDLYRIDEKKLAHLDAATLKMLTDSEAMVLVYANVLSMAHLPRLKEMVEVFAKLKANSKQAPQVDLEKMFGDEDSDVLKF